MLTESIISLGKSEEWFWETELRIVWNLLEENKNIERAKSKRLAAYIACTVWGKNPDMLDEAEDTEKLIPGVDVPIDPELIRGLF